MPHRRADSCRQRDSQSLIVPFSPSTRDPDVNTQPLSTEVTRPSPEATVPPANDSIRKG